MKKIESEELLLSSKSLDELIKLKMEEEMKKELAAKKQKPQPKTVTDIAEVPSQLVFSRQALYRVFNRKTGQETFINGMQAEALIGLQTSVRDKFKARQSDAFATNDAYVKFESIIL